MVVTHIEQLEVLADFKHKLLRTLFALWERAVCGVGLGECEEGDGRRGELEKTAYVLRTVIQFQALK